MTDLDAALDEVTRLRAAISRHRDVVINDERAEYLGAVDLELWLALKES